MKTLKQVLSVFSITLCTLAQQVHAQAWPTAKPIQMIVPAGAGGVSDLVARVIAQALSARVGQTVVVENRPGANGVIGVVAASKASPDGYSFVLGSATTMAANVHLYKDFQANPLADFTPLAMVGEIPFAYVVPRDSPFKTIGDLIRAARATPGKVNYGSGTSAAVLCAELLKLEVGIDMTRVPYKTGPQALTDLIAGRIDMVCESITSLVAGTAGSERLRALALAQPQRTSLAPNLETVSEAGFGNVYFASWIGFWAPAGIPKEISARLSSELLAVLTDPEMRAKLTSFGVSFPAAAGPDALGAAQREEIQKIGRLVKAAKLDPQ